MVREQYYGILETLPTDLAPQGCGFPVVRPLELVGVQGRIHRAGYYARRDIFQN